MCPHTKTKSTSTGSKVCLHCRSRVGTCEITDKHTLETVKQANIHVFRRLHPDSITEASLNRGVRVSTHSQTNQSYLKRQDILSHLREGLSPREACKRTGVTQACYWGWRQRYADFREAVDAIPKLYLKEYQVARKPKKPKTLVPKGINSPAYKGKINRLKREAVCLIQNGFSITQTALELDLGKWTVRNWQQSDPEFKEQIQLAREEKLLRLT